MVTTEAIGTLQRSVRAKELARRPNAVRKLDDGRWWVESQYHPGTGYIVSADLHTCACPDYQRRQPLPCKHIMCAEQADKASKPKPVVVVEVDATGKVLRWHYKDPQLEAERQRSEAERAERTRRMAEIVKELWG